MYYKLLFIVFRNLEDLSNLSDLEGLTRNLIQKGYSEQQKKKRVVFQLVFSLQRNLLL